MVMRQHSGRSDARLKQGSKQVSGEACHANDRSQRFRPRWLQPGRKRFVEKSILVLPRSCPGVRWPALGLLLDLVRGAGMKEGSSKIDEFATQRCIVDVRQVRVYSDAG